MIYQDRKGNKYKGRLRVCEGCGNEKVVRITVIKNVCRKCGAKKRKNSIKDDEVFIVRNGRRYRAEIRTCIKCGKERVSRKDTVNETKMCGSCRSTEGGSYWGKINGPKTRKTGIGSYRKEAFSRFKEVCFCCAATCTERKIMVHHIDENRKNNDITNLIPMCHSCHRRLHNTIKKGLSHDEALREIRYGVEKTN